MTPVSTSFLQSKLDGICRSIELLLLSSVSKPFGIVSSVLEHVNPSEFKVAFNSDSGRFEIAAGTAIMPNGRMLNLVGNVADAPPPLDKSVYVVARVDESIVKAVDSYGIETWLTEKATPTLDVLTPDQLNVLDEETYIKLALITVDDLNYSLDETVMFDKAMRPTFSISDKVHRASASAFSNENNAHGTKLDDIKVGGLTVLAQCTSDGYINTVDDYVGIPGKAVTETHDTDLELDNIGSTVKAGHWFVRLQGVPVAKPHVVNASGFHVDFEWESNTNILDFGYEAPEHIKVTWQKVSDLEVVPSSLRSSTLKFNTIESFPVVSEGHTVETLVYPEADFGPYTGLSLDTVVSLSSEAKCIISPTLIDSSALSANASSTTEKTLASTSQIGITLLDSPCKSQLPSPLGSIVPVSTNFIGTVSLLFTLHRAEERQTLEFTQSPWLTSYYAITTVWRGALFMNGKPVSTKYWHRDDDCIYIDSIKMVQGAKYEMVSPEFDTVRGKNMVTVVGTKATPAGIMATSKIKIIDNSFVAGAGLSVKMGSINGKVSVIAGKQWALQDTAAKTAAAITNALNANALFKRKCVASCSDTEISIATIGLGKAMNSYRAEEISVDGDVNMDVEPFTGGSDSYSVEDYDVVGLSYEINVPKSDLPSGMKVKTYLCTKPAKTSEHKLIATSDLGSIVRITTAAVDTMSSSDVYDLKSKISASVLVSGLDQSGSNVSDTLMLDETSCFEPADYQAGKHTMILTPHTFAKVTGWTVVSASGCGSTVIKVMAEGLSKTGSMCPLAKVKLRGSSLNFKDYRRLKPSTLSFNAVSQRSAFVGSLGLRKLS